jgi:phosphoribosylformimino-5-aminoimidazole carboxamide ribonucleotide (ProFAR) isomerase
MAQLSVEVCGGLRPRHDAEHLTHCANEIASIATKAIVLHCRLPTILRIAGGTQGLAAIAMCAGEENATVPSAWT